MKRSLITLAGALALVLAAPSIQSQVIYGIFPVSGAQEVPPNGSPNSGTATVMLDFGTNVISWNIVHTVGAATAAHFHQAPPGSNGGVIVNLGAPASPMIGSSALTAGQAANAAAGAYYINIHSPAFPAGEIRGQVYMPWMDLGGAYGAPLLPHLEGAGTLTAGSPFSLSLTNAPPSSPGLFWLAFAGIPTPFFGGVVYAFPFNLQINIATNPTGAFTASSIWPSTIPSGTRATLQILIADPGLLGGIALSNGLALQTP
jgi:hypothetical protein